MLKRLGIEASIFRRLLISHFVLVLVSLILTGTIASYVVNGVFQEYVHDDAERTARWVNELLHQQGNIFNDTKRQEVVETLGSLFNVRIWLVDADGEITNSSSSDGPVRDEPLGEGTMEQLEDGDTVYRRGLLDGSPSPVSVVTPMTSDDSFEGAIVVHSSPSPLLAASSRIRESILWIAVVVLIAATGLGSYLAWTISRPLKRITRLATDLTHGRFDQRVTVETEDEIDDLARSINGIADRLERLAQERETFRAARQHFIANASHELRTPLTTIQGYVEALQDGLVADDDTRQRYLDKIHRQCGVLERLVGDLLELNRIESGQLKIALRPVQVWTVVEDAVSQIRADAAARDTTVTVDLPDSLPPILADEVRFRQILLNLLTNAVKFTEDGEIHLRARRSDDGDSLDIVVEDTGSGIPPEDLDHIWTRFYRGANSRRSQGAGLGLTIVKELVEMQDGAVEVDSEAGVGTTFRLRFPLA